MPEGSLVVFSAHGSPPEDFEKAQARNLRVIDAVCPLVTRVHNEAKKYDREGRRVLLVGHRGHQEVRGTMGQVEMTLIDDNAPADLPDWGDDQEIAVLTQTTLSVRDTASAIEAVRERFPQAVVRNDICYATTNRQEAVTKMAHTVDLVLVIGAQNSSNCNRLREVAAAEGVPAYLINGPEEIDARLAARQGKGRHHLGGLDSRSTGGKRHRSPGARARYHAQRRRRGRFLHHATGTALAMARPHRAVQQAAGAPGPAS